MVETTEGKDIIRIEYRLWLEKENDIIKRVNNVNSGLTITNSFLFLTRCHCLGRVIQ